MNKTPKQIVTELNNKFNDNFIKYGSLSNDNLDKSFMYLHCINAVGEILEKRKFAKHHSLCCKIFDEIFSDCASGIYLASIAMDKPAKIVLRRVLELGVAAVYLWDMPHIACSWDNYDQDLSFSEMLNHINSKGYLKYVSEDNSTKMETEIFTTKECQKVYGELSDVVHGKVATFESTLPDRFVFVEADWKSFVALVENVLNILIQGYLKRFNISKELIKRIPQADKEFN